MEHDKKNILFTSDLSGMGGGETSLVNLCDILKKKYNVMVMCAKTGTLVSILDKKGFKTYVIDYRNKKEILLNLFRIREILIHEKISIIHNNDPLTSVIFYVASMGLKIKNYWTCHGQWYQFPFLKRGLIKLSNRYVFCVSTKVYDSLDTMGVKKKGVTYLGIPVKSYSGIEKYKLREEYYLSPKTYVTAVIGRFQPIKGQLKMIQAIEKLLKDGIDIVCFLIGGCIYGSKEEAEYYTRVVNYVKRAHLNKNIIFLGERLDVPNLLKDLDFLTIPSDNESFGMVAIESMASGIPVLSTPNDGVCDILEHDARYIAATNDAEGLYRLIKEYISCVSNEKVAKEYIMERIKMFDIDLIAKKYIDIFELTE